MKKLFQRLIDVKGEKERIQPNEPVPRNACPFYGFATFLGVGLLMDQKGNQCAIAGGYVPCEMEIQGKTPDWRNCAKNALISQEQLLCLEKLRCAPREFWPDGQNSWGGIPFRQWEKYVMDSSTPRPRRT